MKFISPNQFTDDGTTAPGREGKSEAIKSPLHSSDGRADRAGIAARLGSKSVATPLIDRNGPSSGW
jgi:hypothetical protein